jgi:hypothetical protein
LILRVRAEFLRVFASWWYCFRSANHEDTKTPRVTIFRR